MYSKCGILFAMRLAACDVAPTFLEAGVLTAVDSDDVGVTHKLVGDRLGLRFSSNATIYKAQNKTFISQLS